MTKEKWVLKSASALVALSQRCIGLKYVARPVLSVIGLFKIRVSWMTGSEDLASPVQLMWLMSRLKLVKLKEI